MDLDPGLQGPRPHRRHGAAAAEDRPEGHVHRARPGHEPTRRWPRRAGRSRSEHAARRQPRRVPLGARRRHARLPQAADQRRGQGPRGPRRRPAARCSRASSRPTATSRGSTARSPSGAQNLRRLIHSLQRLNTELASSDDDLAELVDVVGRGVPLVRLRGAPTSPRAVARAARHAAPDDRHAGQGRDASPTSSARRRRSCARRSRALDRANQAITPFAKEVDAAPARRHPPVRARGAAARARPARRRREQLAEATPDLTRHVRRAQPPVQPARPTTRTARGPGQGRPRGGLPLLHRLARPPGGEPVLQLGRPRPVPPDHVGGAVRDAVRPIARRRDPGRSRISLQRRRPRRPRSSAGEREGGDG